MDILYRQIHLSPYAEMADLEHQQDMEDLPEVMVLTEADMERFLAQDKDIQHVISVNLLVNVMLEEEEVTIVETQEALLIIQKVPVEQREVITQEQYVGVMEGADTEVEPEERKERGGLAGIVPLAATAPSLSVTTPTSNYGYL